MLEPVSDAAGTDDVLGAIVAIFSVLIGFSALIAAVGMVNNLSLSVLQRTRELGLLRALGFTNRQLRDMVRVEAAQLTVAAMLVGVVLGIGYGWVGAESLLASAPGGGLVFPVVPWWLIAVVVGAGAVLTLVASVAPTRRATSIAPVVALSVE
jgi:putative ABC transport system permease protein